MGLRVRKCDGSGFGSNVGNFYFSLKFGILQIDHEGAFTNKSLPSEL